MDTTYKTPSLDDISAAYDAQQAASSGQGQSPMPMENRSTQTVNGEQLPGGWTRGSSHSLIDSSRMAVDASGEVAQIPFDPSQDKTPGFFGALKDAYKRSSLADGNNAFNSPNIFESLGQGVLNRFQPHVADDKRTFTENVGADLVAMGAGLPIALSHPIETAKATFYGGKEGDSVGSRLKQGAIVQSLGQVFDKQYYKEHPGIAAVNTGSWIASLFSFGLTGALKTAAKTGVASAVEEATIAGVEKATVSSAMTTIQKSGALRRATEQAFKTGDTAIIQEVAKQALVRQGVEEVAASQIAQKVAGGVGTHFTENATKMKVYQAGAHPLSSLKQGVGYAVDPLKKVVFGEPANSAVGRIYGAETVARDPQAFLDLEKWAGQQTMERGLKNTLNNREMIMNDWSKTVPEWSVLTPEERLTHFQNYVRSTELSQQIAAVTGDAVVPVKFLPKDTVDAIQKTIMASPEAMSPVGILDELQSIYGSDIKNHRQSLEALLAKEPTRDALAAGIEALGNRETLGYAENAQAAAMVKELEQATGYHLAQAPVDKIVSYATPEAQAAAEAASKLPGAEAIPTVAKVSKPRPVLGQLMEKFGLSPTGGNEGTLEYLFQDNFNQAAVKELTKKYGATFTVEHKTIPFSKLYEYLSASKDKIFERKRLEGSLSQVLAPGSGSVVDMTARNLVQHGFSPTLAEDIVAISKQALLDVPLEKTGLADGFVNLLKAKVPGYSKFLNVAMNGRFNLNPFYGMQAWVELEFNKAVALGDLKSAAKAFSFGERTDNFIAKTLQKIPYLRDAINPALNYNEIQLVGTELLGDMQQNTLSAASNPEMALLQKAGEFGGTPSEMQRYAASIQSKNITFRALGYTTQRAATGFVKALAEKYGFSLEDALSSSVVKGNKVYNNPEMFNMLREATQDLAGYKPGFLTSPLAKTMNVIWFPFRFEAKTVMGVAETIGKLPPLTRIGVMSDWTHFANWAQTPEGVAWRKQNSHKWYNVLNYVFTWESSGKALKDVLGGRLFGGNTGQLGGLPLGFITNVIQDLGFAPDYPREGSKGFAKKIPKNIMSAATAQVVIQDLVSHMMPKMPLYQLFDIRTTPDSYVKNTLIPGIFSTVWGGGEKTSAKKFQREFKNLQPGKTR